MNTDLKRFEYKFLPIDIIPQEIIEKYNLHKITKNGKVYIEIRKGMYGLPQDGIIANQKLKKLLHPYSYTPCRLTAGLWKHDTKDITFTLVLDDFGIKYTNRKDAEHLIGVLKDNHPSVTVDWTGVLYCGIKLDWDYQQHQGTLSMSEYIPNPPYKVQHKQPK